MHRIKVPWNESDMHTEDIRRIVKVLEDRGYVASPMEAQALWARWADGMAPGWMSTRSFSDDDVFESIRHWFDIGEEIA